MPVLMALPASRASELRSSGRRCLILADGFYEWQKAVGKGPNQPFYIRMKDEHPFTFAGLWEHWQGPDGAIDSCTIITTDANDVLKPLHHRMPVILGPKDYERWLDPAFADPGVLQEMLGPYPANEMAAIPVSTYVNNPRNDGEQCLARD